jgi:putative hydrolase of the HAD superfamily
VALLVRAVFFDVDFTLIYPGPGLRAEGYQRFCQARGVSVDPARFAAAVARAVPILDEVTTHNYDARLFVDYTRAIIEHMGGSGPATADAARDIYDEWARCRNFFLYDDVLPALEALAGAGVKIGLISNTQRPLDTFAAHFGLDGLIAGAVSSAEHGYLKPHPAIFEAALLALGVQARESVMVGDSVRHDIEGARRIGMRAVLLRRSDGVSSPLQRALGEGFDDVPVMSTLASLPGWLATAPF